jgi:transaldolase/glucose-6-phosphate isomerase
LDEWNNEGDFKKAEPLLMVDGFSIYGSKVVEQIRDKNSGSVGSFVNAFSALSKPDDYIAFLPYFLMTDSRMKTLQGWRMETRDKNKKATTLLNGPRYLHSTGQLHKGGPATGLYILLVGDESADMSIPDEKYGFATLHKAQSLGDYRSLNDKKRRVIRVNLGKDIDKGLEQLWQSIKK